MYTNIDVHGCNRLCTIMALTKYTAKIRQFRYKVGSVRVTSFIFIDGELVINEVIYNSFVWVTLGCFGISSFEKVKTK